jgi:hypothetical protein
MDGGEAAPLEQEAAGGVGGHVVVAADDVAAVVEVGRADA